MALPAKRNAHDGQAMPTSMGLNGRVALKGTSQFQLRFPPTWGFTNSGAEKVDFHASQQKGLQNHYFASCSLLRPILPTQLAPHVIAPCRRRPEAPRSSLPGNSAPSAAPGAEEPVEKHGPRRWTPNRGTCTQKRAGN